MLIFLLGVIVDLSLIDLSNYAFLGFGALSGKMLLVRIVENNRIDDYLGQVS